MAAYSSGRLASSWRRVLHWMTCKSGMPSASSSLESMQELGAEPPTEGPDLTPIPIGTVIDRWTITHVVLESTSTGAYEVTDGSASVLLMVDKRQKFGNPKPLPPHLEASRPGFCWDILTFDEFDEVIQGQEDQQQATTSLPPIVPNDI